MTLGEYPGHVEENHPQYGLYRFKKGFAGEFTEFIGEIYIPFKPFIYEVYKIAEKTFKKVRGIIAAIKGNNKRFPFGRDRLNEAIDNK